jgi:hypothetical protein
VGAITCTVGRDEGQRFSETARFRSVVGRHARPHRRQLDALRCDDRAVAQPVPGWGLADDPPEGATERPEAGESDVEADLGHAPIGLAKQEHRAFDPPSLQVPVRRLAEDVAEAAAEVRRRDVRDGGHRADVERLRIGAVHRIAGTKEAPIHVLGVAAHPVTLPRSGGIAQQDPRGANDRRQ